MTKELSHLKVCVIKVQKSKPTFPAPQARPDLWSAEVHPPSKILQCAS